MANKNIQQNEKIKSSNLLALVKDLEPNSHLLHLSVLRQLNNNRAGTASTKTKSEVRGGGKKPWKQKGTGRARAGSIRSPLWVGGGITFGPKPRDFSTDLPKKASKLALAQAIAAKVADITTLKKLPEVKDAKTKNFLSAMKSSNLLNLPLLIIVSKSDQNLSEFKRASKNVQNVSFADKDTLGVYDLLKAKTVVITDAASEELKFKLHDVLGKEVAEKVKKKVVEKVKTKVVKKK
jgi:large subunit ribosomal protein L4